MADTPPDNRGALTEPLDSVAAARLAPTVLPGSSSQDEMYCAQCSQSYGSTTIVCPADGTKLVRIAADRDLLLGKVLDGRYEIKAPLGKGGMGSVYSGMQLSVDREVAIKVIHPKLASDRAAVKRFLREARLASRLSQPSIVNVYDFGQSEGVLFLVMELLRGHTLASELGRGRRISVRRSLTIATQLCDALEAAHAQDIIHRDLKPGNIIILDDPSGRDLIKVLDFGLAKSIVASSESRVTETDAIMGTPLYMAPEQISGNASDQRADLYALGCILFEMLSGAPPFSGNSPNAILTSHLTAPVPVLPSHVPVRVAALITRLLAKEPVDRIQAAGDVRGVLELALESAAVRSMTPVSGVPILDTPDTVPEPEPTGFAATAMASAITPARPPIEPTATARRRLPLVIGVVGVIAIATIVVVLMRNRGADETPPADARATGGTPPAPDAAAMRPEAAVVVVDAAEIVVDAVTTNAVDAAVVIPVDARRTIVRTPVDAAVRAPVDATVQTPHVDAKAGPVIDFYPKKP